MKRKYKGNRIVLGLREDKTPIIWDDAVRNQAPHAAIFGGSGSGKTRALAAIAIQHIEQWSTTHQGTLLIEENGEITDLVTAWLADRPEYHRVPVYFIDARKRDFICPYSFGLKPRPGVASDVIAENIVNAITHVHGGADVTQTPRLARCLRPIIQATYETGRALPDVLALLDYRNAEARNALIQQLEPSTARDFLAQLDGLGKREFDTVLESSINRMSSFASNRYLSTMMGAIDTPTFDMEAAVREGAIVIMCVASAGGNIAASHGKLMGTWALSDLWQVLQQIGKFPGGYAKPFTLMIDECHNFVTYPMSLLLPEARGYGLQIILSTQRPSYFLSHGGAHGEAIYQAVMAETGTKVCFRTEDEHHARLPLVEAMFGPQVDINKVALTSFQTIGFTQVTRILKGGGSSVANGRSEGVTDSETISFSDGEAFGNGKSLGTSEADMDSSSRTRAKGYSLATGATDSTGESVTIPDATTGVETPLPIRTTNTGAGTNQVEVNSTTDSETDAEAHTRGRSAVDTNSFTLIHNQAESNSTAYSIVDSLVNTESESWRQQITLEPILEERPTQLVSVDNQLYEYGQRMSTLLKRHAYCRLPGESEAIKMETDDFPEAEHTPGFIERWRVQKMASTPFMLRYKDAQQCIAENKQKRLAAPSIEDELRKAALSGARPRGKVEGPSDAQ